MYRYVGPEEIRRASLATSNGVTIRTQDQLLSWLHDADAVNSPVTFVIDEGGDLVLAPRESEHVGAAQGRAVWSAGEIAFDSNGAVVTVTNQSTGYCPEPRSWSAVASALEALGSRHQGSFTTAYEFRRCAECQSINLVKDADFVCAECGAALPADWNLGRQSWPTIGTPAARSDKHGLQDDYVPRSKEELRFLAALLPILPDLDVWPHEDERGAWLLVSFDISEGGWIRAVPRLDFDGRTIVGAYSPASLNWDSYVVRAVDAGLGPGSIAWIALEGQPDELATAAARWFRDRISSWRRERGQPGTIADHP